MVGSRIHPSHAICLTTSELRAQFESVTEIFLSQVRRRIFGDAGVGLERRPRVGKSIRPPKLFRPRKLEGQQLDARLQRFPKRKSRRNWRQNFGQPTYFPSRRLRRQTNDSG